MLYVGPDEEGVRMYRFDGVNCRCRLSVWAERISNLRFSLHLIALVIEFMP